MKKITVRLVLGVLIGASLAGLGLLWFRVHRALPAPHPTPAPTLESLEPRAQEQLIAQALREAPWQGLRFLPQEQEWRFYGWSGETRQVQFNAAYDLIKVTYLQAGGDLAFTWVVTGFELPGQGYQPTALSPVEPGQVVAVRLFGEHVGLWGVDWPACDSEICRLANTVDSILVLDERGTGLSNAFIRYGWEPPAYPLYGFLCWSLEALPADPGQ